MKEIGPTSVVLSGVLSMFIVLLFCQNSGIKLDYRLAQGGDVITLNFKKWLIFLGCCTEHSGCSAITYVCARTAHSWAKCQKTRQILDQKNSWNWLVTFVPATIWQIFFIVSLRVRSLRSCDYLWGQGAPLSRCAKFLKYSAQWFQITKIRRKWTE